MTDSATNLITAWADALAVADRSRHTIRAYTRTLYHFAAWYAEERHMPLLAADLTPIDGKAYRDDLQTRQLAPASINQAIAALRTFGDWLVESQQRPDNPFARLKQIQAKAALAPQALTSKELNALLREAQTTNTPARDYAIVQLLAQTGLRRSECAALAVGDLMIGERLGSLLVRSGKGQGSRRVPINASARQALAEYLGPRWGVEPTVRVVAAIWPQRDPREALWLGQRGPLTDKAIADVVDTLVARCAARGLVPASVSAHTLRHSFATAYLQSHPGDLVGLAALLGHTTIETTKIYVQPTEDDLHQRVERSALNAYG